MTDDGVDADVVDEDVDEDDDEPDPRTMGLDGDGVRDGHLLEADVEWEWEWVCECECGCGWINVAVIPKSLETRACLLWPLPLLPLPLLLLLLIIFQRGRNVAAAANKNADRALRPLGR